MDALTNWIQKHVTIQYIPIHEFLLSLHVLGSPYHHLERLNWSEKTLKELPLTVNKELKFFKSLSSEYLNIMDMVLPWDEKAHLSIEAGLEKIEQLSNAEFIAKMLDYETDRIANEAWLKNNEANLFGMKPEIRELIKQPKATKRRLLDFLYQYLTYFRSEHRRIEPWIIKAVHEGQQNLKKDPLSFMKEIHPRFTIHPSFVQFQKDKTYQFFYKDLKTIYIHPSTFISPHLLMGIYNDSITVGLHLEVPGTSSVSDIPLDFIKMMKALSDPKRAAILKSLLEHPYSIQQLADIHHISAPAVTKHINQLKEVDLVWGERRGYYVFYRGNSKRLDMLTVEIHQFIDMPNPNHKKNEE